MFKVSNYVGLKKMLAVGTKQEIMVHELTGFSDGLDREGDVGIKALKLVICYTLIQGRKSARRKIEGRSNEFISCYLLGGDNLEMG